MLDPDLAKLQLQQPLITCPVLDGVFLSFHCRWLFWIDGNSIMMSQLDGSGGVIYVNGSKPLGITMDFVSEKLYWTDSAGIVWEGTVDGSSIQAIYFDNNFVPFKVSTVRNFVLVTSQVNNSYVLINREDSSVALVRTDLGTFYYGVSVVSVLKKPSHGEL